MGHEARHEAALAVELDAPISARTPAAYAARRSLSLTASATLESPGCHAPTPTPAFVTWPAIGSAPAISEPLARRAHREERPAPHEPEDVVGGDDVAEQVRGGPAQTGAQHRVAVVRGVDDDAPAQAVGRPEAQRKVEVDPAGPSTSMRTRPLARACSNSRATLKRLGSSSPAMSLVLAPSREKRRATGAASSSVLAPSTSSRAMPGSSHRPTAAPAGRTRARVSRSDAVLRQLVMHEIGPR